MSIIPCEQNLTLRDRIEAYAEVLKVEAHKLGSHGLSEDEFYNSGLFRGAIERVRGQFSATMRDKRDFMRRILNHMQDAGFIVEWLSAGGAKGPYRLPPPCIYLFPATIPSTRNNPNPPAQSLGDVQILDALYQCFGGTQSELV
jgi:hypothetical protein